MVIPTDRSSNRSSYLYAVQEALQRDTSRLQLIILSFDNSRKEYHAEDVVKRFLKKEQSHDFSAFADTLIGQKRGEGHRSLVIKYRSPLNSLNRFLKGRLLTFNDINASRMKRYENYLEKSG